MKKIFLALLVCLVPMVSYAEDCDMGGMTLDNYAYYIALLGLFCGIAFILGIKQ